MPADERRAQLIESALDLAERGGVGRRTARPSPVASPRVNSPRILLAAALAGAAALPGCVSRIVPSEDASVTESAGPYPTDYLATGRRWAEREIRLITVIEEFWMEPPKPGFAEGSMLFSGDPVDGWRAVLHVAGRDALGFSTGEIVYAVLFKDGEIVEYQKLLW